MKVSKHGAIRSFSKKINMTMNRSISTSTTKFVGEVDFGLACVLFLAEHWKVEWVSQLNLISLSWCYGSNVLKCRIEIISGFFFLKENANRNSFQDFQSAYLEMNKHRNLKRTYAFFFAKEAHFISDFWPVVCCSAIVCFKVSL